jgi:hypothetical protein
VNLLERQIIGMQHTKIYAGPIKFGGAVWLSGGKIVRPLPIKFVG